MLLCYLQSVLWFFWLSYTLTCSISQFSCHRRSGTCWIFYSLCRRTLFRGCLELCLTYCGSSWRACFQGSFA
ncbi:hypothetical protein BDB00DRAFT_853466 [Zychaea mexicana]|uniref:uncharacterized protein n=1 Tax=Zychaea mexicana TaxID=64656 RepID=UPI0022FEDE0C|nr:uncharacterized protein BDB00DRAFT_862906 [Zychaea mexicana]XP_052973790.1 uncharacterized protein BDB00DRAFT_853466 [Zychaea mexicana]KAI9470125.1 hypothetical protein BDB00DRAFT_862906 [Zychaea mexicana]KAI9484777.1 hypothetical protein BDB00DRAFT_853466 [Zychaea mexicana]